MLDLTLTEQTARAYDSLKCLIFLNTDTERYVVLRDMTACNVWKSRVGMRYKYSVQLTENGRCDFECCIKVAYMQVSGRLKTLQLCGWCECQRGVTPFSPASVTPQSTTSPPSRADRELSLQDTTSLCKARLNVFILLSVCVEDSPRRHSPRILYCNVEKETENNLFVSCVLMLINTTWLDLTVFDSDLRVWVLYITM